MKNKSLLVILVCILAITSTLSGTAHAGSLSVPSSPEYCSLPDNLEKANYYSYEITLDVNSATDGMEFSELYAENSETINLNLGREYARPIEEIRELLEPKETLVQARVTDGKRNAGTGKYVLGDDNVIKLTVISKKSLCEGEYDSEEPYIFGELPNTLKNVSSVKSRLFCNPYGAPAYPFGDVVSGSYYQVPVNWGYANGIANGTSHDKFSPKASCTRAQIVTFLWRAAGMPTPSFNGSAKYSDVSEDSYYYVPVAWASENGIVNGTGNGKFSPDKTCTRAEIVTLIWRYCGGCNTVYETEEAADNKWKDVKSGSYYSTAAVWVGIVGVIEGTDNKTFSPNKTCTRAEALTILSRVFVTPDRFIQLPIQSYN